MSTSTVIASTRGLSLYLAPLAPAPEVPAADIDAVLRTHGLVLLPQALEGPEFIAGQDLDHVEAARLAEDLRAIGLVVRVVPRDGIHQSRRVGNAVAANLLLAGSALSPGIVLLASVLVRPLFLLPALFLLLVGGYALANLVALMSRGGPRLALAGAPAAGGGELGQAVAAIHVLAEALPDHVGRPLVERAVALERRARHNPEGEAAAALRSLRHELEDLQDAADLAAVRELRADVAEARRAVHEAVRGTPQ